MKHICILFNAITSGNGVARAAMSVAELLSKEGYDITLLPLYQIEKKLVKKLSPKIQVKKLYGFYFRGFSFLTHLIPLKLYHKILGLNQYDELIAFQYGLSTKIVSAYNIGSNKKVLKIAWMHGYDEGLRLRKYYLGFDKVICVSQFNANRLKNELNPGDKPQIDYCYNPIDDGLVNEFGRESIEIIKPGIPVFICVGRQSEEKGYLRLISIMGTLKKEGYNFELWMVGDGPLHDELIGLANTQGLSDVVRFMGAQINPHKYTAKADVFICSSFSEGYSTACTEAIMLGVPVITTSVSGGEEIIRDAECGLLTGKDDESLKKAIKSVLDNPNIIEEWKSILKKSKNTFSLTVRRNKLLSIIK